MERPFPRVNIVYGITITSVIELFQSSLELGTGIPSTEVTAQPRELGEALGREPTNFCPPRPPLASNRRTCRPPALRVSCRRRNRMGAGDGLIWAPHDQFFSRSTSKGENKPDEGTGFRNILGFEIDTKSQTCRDAWR